ncbi:MAG: hypothetical protein JWQ96_31 [Segetibacter sp.]|nr:hypothetical protein [Segetibacter sp.]
MESYLGVMEIKEKKDIKSFSVKWRPVGIAAVAIAVPAVFVLLTRWKDENIRFEKALKEINPVEQRAVGQLQRLKYFDEPKKAAAMLKDSTMNDWKMIESRLNKVEPFDLNEENLRRKELMQEYVKLRLDETQVLYQALTENTNRYDKQLEEIITKIEDILASLNS